MSRQERAALERRRRAHEHLDRRRGGRRPAARRSLAWLPLAISVVAGALLGSPLVRAAAGGLSPTPPRVSAIHVRGAEQLAPERVAAASGVEPGTEVGAVDPETVAARIAELPWVARARAVQLPLGPLLVEVEERVAVALARAGASRAFVDAAGTAFAPLEGDTAPELPELWLPDPFSIGAADPRLASALDLLAQVTGRGLPEPEQVRVAAENDPEGFSLKLPDLDGRVILGREDLEARLAALAELLASGLSEIAGAAQLDLRFADQAVLRRGPAEGGSEAGAGGRPSPPTTRSAG
jgi:cell division septal protein FtsQ